MTTVNDFAPFIETVGGGFVGGMLAGYAIKKVLKFAAADSWAVYFGPRVSGISEID